MHIALPPGCLRIAASTCKQPSRAATRNPSPPRSAFRHGGLAARRGGRGGKGFNPAHLIAGKLISLCPLIPSPSPPQGRREQEGEWELLPQGRREREGEWDHHQRIIRLARSSKTTHSPPRPVTGRGGRGVRGTTQRISSLESSSRSAPSSPALLPRRGEGSERGMRSSPAGEKGARRGMGSSTRHASSDFLVTMGLVPIGR